MKDSVLFVPAVIFVCNSCYTSISLYQGDDIISSFTFCFMYVWFCIQVELPLLFLILHNQILVWCWVTL